MEPGKLIVADEEYDVLVCEDCMEHEGQVKFYGRMLCYGCFMDRCSICDDEDDTYLQRKNSISDFSEENDDTDC